MKKNATILYIEDEELVRNQAAEYLSLIYENVMEAKNGLEGLEVYKKYKPHIIISDIEMPKMNGLKMVQEVRKLDKKIPIIITTAYTQSEYLLKALQLQLIKYIVKPITVDKLKSALSIAHHYIDEEILQSIIKFSKSASYDSLNKVLVIDEKIVKLSHNEIIFTDLLTKNYHRVVTYDEIESTIWAYAGMSKDSLRTLVRTLRKKMQGEFVENVSGYGYKIKVL